MFAQKYITFFLYILFWPKYVLFIIFFCTFAFVFYNIIWKISLI